MASVAEVCPHTPSVVIPHLLFLLEFDVHVESETVPSRVTLVLQHTVLMLGSVEYRDY